MTLGEFVNGARESLGRLYLPAEAKALVFRLTEHFFETPSYKYISEPEMEVDATKASRALDELCEGRPIQYVLGYAEFCGHKFRVAEGCLIPRPETEELVYRIFDNVRDTDKGDDIFNILDLCTGSGCIAYSLSDGFPSAMVYGCDISPEALSIACRQKIKLQGARPVLFQADILSDPPAGLPPFDVIVSNPPYVCESEKALMRRNVLDYEPSQALFVPDSDPLVFYRAISRWAERLLKSDGSLFLEVNERFADKVSALFPGSSVHTDIFGKPRFVTLQYATRLGGGR